MNRLLNQALIRLSWLIGIALACNTLTGGLPSPTPLLAGTPPQLPLPTLGPSATAFPLATPIPAISSPRPSRTPTGALLPTAIIPLPTFTPWLDNPPLGRIVFVCFIDGFDNLCLMNADGSNVQRLTFTAATDFYPCLSPDGQQIAFSSRRDNNFEIYVMNTDGGDPRRLTQNAGSNFAPEFSPDGSRIVFVSARGGAQNIWVMNTDGTHLTQITDTTGDNIDPSWSPDGRQIAFASNRGGTNELYVMPAPGPAAQVNADGSNVQPVTFDLNIGGRNDWSPDGQRLTFYAGPENQRNIFVINADGTGLTQITDVSDNRGPTFSPDGNWIAFASFRDRNNEIYIAHPDGTGLTRLTSDRRPDWQPRWGP